eukprot:comp11447_c0_seq1/m.5871 comp11447_c0_seq1/g.5871  ORF comp11447_c0_seq1/g.5871 comp11447_c0_seq1/m.5871 type:complete len:501 (-) comp11447_c0_seq1:21-1523(-)
MSSRGKIVTASERQVSLLVLFLINLLNYMDRMTISGVLSIKDPEKAGFLHELTFTEGGLLQTCFVITFMCLAPVFGYLGDRHTRKHIITFGIVFWCSATLLCSFCDSYWQLMVCRALVGVGEASYATIAPTIIADLYAEEARTRALALFYIGIPCGGALGYLGGVVGSIWGFRWAFRMTPGIGLIMAFASHFLLVEPERGAAEGGHESNMEHGLGAFWRDTVKCFKVPSFTYSTIGFTAVTFATGALGLWGPKFIVESTEGTPYETSTEAVSMTLGVITAINGVVGTLAGAWLAQWMYPWTDRAEPLVCLVGMLIAVPTCGPGLFIFDKQAYVAWGLLFVAEFGLCLNWALVAVILLSTIPPQRRSIAEAIQILASHVFGDALSPYLVGAVSDGLVARGLSKGRAMGWALELCMFVAVAGGMCFGMNAWYYPDDKELMKLQMAEGAGDSQRLLTQDGSPTTLSSTNSLEETTPNAVRRHRVAGHGTLASMSPPIRADDHA